MNGTLVILLFLSLLWTPRFTWASCPLLFQDATQLNFQALLAERTRRIKTLGEEFKKRNRVDPDFNRDEIGSDLKRVREGFRPEAKKIHHEFFIRAGGQYRLVPLAFRDRSNPKHHLAPHPLSYTLLRDPLSSGYYFLRSRVHIPALRSFMSSVVRIKGLGSAVHIGGGFFLTAGHCINRSDGSRLIKKEIIIHQFNEEEIPIHHRVTLREKNIHAHPVLDVGLLYIPALSHLPSLKVSRETPQLGTRVFTTGFPGIMQRQVISPGHFLGLNEYEGVPRGLLNTSATSHPGMSGGALINAKGELMGVIVFSAPQSKTQRQKQSQSTSAQAFLPWLDGLLGTPALERGKSPRATDTHR